MAEKIAWVLCGIALLCAVAAALTSPFRLETVSVSCGGASIGAGLLGILIAVKSWKEK